jgi:G3E family GTPase
MHKPIFREKLEAALQSLESDVWRAKGFVRISGENDLFLVQFTGIAGAQFEIERFEPRNMNELPPSELVFIGPAPDKNELWRAFTGNAPLL